MICSTKAEFIASIVSLIIVSILAIGMLITAVKIISTTFWWSVFCLYAGGGFVFIIKHVLVPVVIERYKELKR